MPEASILTKRAGSAAEARHSVPESTFTAPSLNSAGVCQFGGKCLPAGVGLTPCPPLPTHNPMLLSPAGLPRRERGWPQAGGEVRPQTDMHPVPLMVLTTLLYGVTL